MKIINLQQGSKEWLEHRANHFNASDAPAMLGVSEHESRQDLMKRLAFGQNDPSSFQQKIFDKGHEYEALARPIAEKLIDDQLFPIVGVSDEYPKLSASFDGMTLDESVIFEHKTLNKKIASFEKYEDGFIANRHYFPEQYLVQMEHQLIVSGANTCLFLATKWDNELLIDQSYFYYFSDKELRNKILAGWTLFEKELEEFKKTYKPAAPVIANQLDILPSLRVEVKGEVIASNINEFEAQAMSVLNSINTTLTTDQDFANATETVKWCKDVGERLKASKDAVIKQTVSISELLDTLDRISKKTDRVRLDLSKLIEAEKEARKVELVNEFVAKINEAIAKYKNATGLIYPPVNHNFAMAIKGKRTLDSMRDALFARCHELVITIDNDTATATKNLEYFASIKKSWLLNIDLATIAIKPHDEFVAIVDGKLAQLEKQLSNMDAPQKPAEPPTSDLISPPNITNGLELFSGSINDLDVMEFTTNQRSRDLIFSFLNWLKN